MILKYLYFRGELLGREIGSLLGLSFSLMLVIKFGGLRIIGIDYQGSFVQTPLPTLTGIFFLGAVCSLFFGILAEVLVRIRYEARQTKPYIVRSTLDSHERPSILDPRGQTKKAA